MSVKDFEAYHGIVLTKLVRSDHPVSLRMIETNKDEAWCAYTINDAAILYIKYRTKGRKTKRQRGMSWVFTFPEDELHNIDRLSNAKPVYLALVCAHKEPMCICILEPDEIHKCMNIKTGGSENITVLYQKNKSLRAYGPQNSDEDQKLVIPQNRLDEWQVPGS